MWGTVLKIVIDISNKEGDFQIANLDYKKINYTVVCE